VSNRAIQWIKNSQYGGEVKGHEMEKARKNRTYDIIIIGGGIMGSATAYYLLKNDCRLKVAVVERDPTYTYASTTLSMANIRIQFSLKENVQVSQYAFEALDRFEEEMAIDDERPNIAFRREGNLFLVDEEGRSVAEKALALQKSLGCPVEWWSPKEIMERFPLYEASPFLGGPSALRTDTWMPMRSSWVTRPRLGPWGLRSSPMRRLGY
jgi:glycine/D-amino acid oxidase-like deaminating enzyme